MSENRDVRYPTDADEAQQHDHYHCVADTALNIFPVVFSGSVFLEP